jgi:hypothetical protein
MFGRQEDARMKFDDAKLLAAAAIEGSPVQQNAFRGQKLFQRAFSCR